MGKKSKHPHPGRKVKFKEGYPKFVAIGKILEPWGDRGEVKVEILTDFPERFYLLERVYLGQTARPLRVKKVKIFKSHAVLQLEGCESRAEASALKGQILTVPLEELMPLAEGEYYEFEIIGLEVWTEEGLYLGRVKEIIYTGANDVYVVGGHEREVLIPALDDVIIRIDLEEGKMVVKLPEGLLS
ncbi:MAG: ribosome maturation factor RimM [Anaerolineae bacterium]|nr:ribosome maturation factor RimM [Anaerolineae bacterium]MDW8103057.1 ribosome maturation factor RimM [Anaerolineae bacterium]